MSDGPAVLIPPSPFFGAFRRGAPQVFSLGLLCLSACGGSGGTPPCGVRQQRELAPSTLTLSERAELEPMGSGFFLHAADTDGRTVRWATLSSDGALGLEQRLAVPEHNASQGPWVALAGKDQPFDRVLVFFGVPSTTNPGQDELKVLAAPVTGLPDGGAPPDPVTVAVLPTPPAALRLTVGSGAAGRHAGVAFGLSGVEALTFLVVDGGGSTVVGPQSVGGGAGALDFKCLRVTSAFGGPSDMVLGYVRQASDSDPAPSWRAIDVDAQGLLSSSIAMTLSSASPTCPSMALPVDGSVTLAWNDPQHAWFVDWPPSSSQLFPKQVAAAAAQEGGVLPPVAGLGSFGKKFGILYDRSAGGLVRVVDALGVAQQSDVSLPAHAARVGALSSVASAAGLYATYADYDSPAAATGRRQWLRLGCE